MGTIYEVPRIKGSWEQRIAYVAKDGIDKPGFYIMVGHENATGKGINSTHGPYRTEREAQDALDELADESGWRYNAAWN